MLKYLYLDDVGRGPLVVRPHFLLLEAHPIERNRRQPTAHLRELLRIGEAAAKALDLAGVAADVERRADMPQWRGGAHFDFVSHVEAGSDRRILSRELGLRASAPLPFSARALPWR